MIEPQAVAPLGPTEDVASGSLRVDGKEADYRLRCDRLAVDTAGVLRVASVVATAAQVRGMAAALASTAGAVVYPDMPLACRGATHDYDRYRPVRKCDVGYIRRLHKLEYGYVHAVMISRAPGLLVADDDETLWRALASDRFTTPILREWTPYLRTELTRRNKLIPLRTFRCRAAQLVATDADLDEIVTRGCRAGAFAASFRVADTIPLATEE